MTHVVVLEDNEILLNRLAIILKQSEICSDVSTAATIASCEKLLQESHVDILLADLHLPDGSGTPEVDVSECDVVDALMIPAVIIAVDEDFDLSFKVTRQEVVFQ